MGGRSQGQPRAKAEESWRWRAGAAGTRRGGRVSHPTLAKAGNSVATQWEQVFLEGQWDGGGIGSLSKVRSSGATFQVPAILSKRTQKPATAAHPT